MKSDFIVGDKVRIKGKRLQGEIVKFGESVKHILFAEIYTTRCGLYAIPLDKLEKVKKRANLRPVSA